MARAGRIHKLLPGELSAEQRALYDAIVDGPRAQQASVPPLVDADGALEGPFNAFLLQPALGHALQAVGATLRYRGRLPHRTREVAILVVAACKNAEFERLVHEPVARSLGLTDEHLAAIRVGEYDALPADEAAIAGAVREMVLHGDLSDAAFSELQPVIGAAETLELIALVGYYTLLALLLRVLRIASPAPPA